jgi:hypothetical protein
MTLSLKSNMKKLLLTAGSLLFGDFTTINLQSPKSIFTSKKIPIYFGNIFDDFGAQLFEEPQDLTQTNNKERIKQGMIGIWRIVDHAGDRLRLIKEKEERKVGTYGSLVFRHIDVKFIKRAGCGTGFNFEDFKKRCINDWALDDGNILSMQVYGFEDKKYKITYLSRYEMCLMLVR